MTGAVEEVQLLIEINCLRSERYDLIQERAVPDKPRAEWRREMSMEWLMVSKAALRSRRMRMEREPESAERRMSLVTLRRAVSVLWSERKPDWKVS